ncbi:uncharacterized protein [Rutidosis leptorrhynchoides]|uniref:uncharacterized protein n=1 Tax=Rutidosis leptorrhynchoides TaxID=125765 RepID=UPI003A99E17E
MPNGVGSTFNTLLPKVNNPTLVKDYRPISLIGVYYKIIAKILVSRLATVIDKVISIEQFAFIANRQILDGPLILSEVINWYKENSMKLMILKVDFEKAYDTGLHLDRQNAVDMNVIKGVNVGSDQTNISHLFYADDALIVSEWNHEEMDNIIQIFDIFFLASGLRINVSKSNVYGINVSETEMAEMVIRTLECIRSAFFWGSDDEAKKMSWIKWDSILSSLDKGGLGVGSLEAFNLALNFKWIWRFYTQTNQLWRKVIQSIYGQRAAIDNVTGFRNNIWTNLIKSYLKSQHVNLLPSNPIVSQVNNGNSTLFWIDNWLNGKPLKDQFNRLFHIGGDQFSTIHDKVASGEWNWYWNRENIGGRNEESLNTLRNLVQNIHLTNDIDHFKWSIVDTIQYNVWLVDFVSPPFAAVVSSGDGCRHRIPKELYFLIGGASDLGGLLGWVTATGGLGWLLVVSADLLVVSGGGKQRMVVVDGDRRRLLVAVGGNWRCLLTA